MARHPHTIVIIGGGFSGTVLAANLLRRPPSRATRVVLVERCAETGGAAYAARPHPFLLNVPVGRMSADVDAPHSFLEFARRQSPSVQAEDFVPRAWYGEYLEALLAEAEQQAPEHVRFKRIRGDVVNVARVPRSRALRAELADGQVLQADDVVLACGNPPPALLPGLEPVAAHHHYVHDACRDLPADGYRGEVLLIGTGLTMADTALAAASQGESRVHAISRHGLVPPSQASGTHAHSPEGLAQRVAGATSVRALLRVARELAAEARQTGADWRDVVNGIREQAPQIWRRLEPAERQRFLRHLRPYWDVHRHRLPPATAERLDELRNAGKLQVHAGRILHVRPEGRRLCVTWRPRGDDAARELTVDWIVNCTGPDYDLRRSKDPLFRSLIGSGLAVPDGYGLGLRTGARGALVDSRGRISQNLYCLGPMLRAEHWETTAVAELRSHAASLASHLASDASDSSLKQQELFMSHGAIRVGTPAPVAAAVPPQIDQRVYALYDEYCHGHIDRREFLVRARALLIGGVSALAMTQALFPRYAEAQTISFTDERIKARYVDYDSPGGNSGKMRGYLVQPAGAGPFPAVLVIHENRGLNPYIEDVARRLGVEGFLALAPDGLAPAGGYPGNDDDGRALQSGLDQAKLRQDLVNSARYLKAHAASSGKLGATGFCFGGGIVNHLAVTLGEDLAAGVPFYGAAPVLEDVPKIKAALLLQYAATDERINAQWPPYEAALKAHGVRYEAHVYPGTQHGFHNNSTPRYDEAAAKLAWERTVAHFRRHLV